MGAAILLSYLVFLSDSPSFSIICLISVISFSSVISNFFKFLTNLSTGISIDFSSTGSAVLGIKTLGGKFKAVALTAAHGLAAAKSA